MNEKKKVLKPEQANAGNIEKEISAIRQLQRENAEGIYTISSGCSGVFTLICC